MNRVREASHTETPAESAGAPPPRERIRRDYVIIGIAVAACLLPFTGKAFHIDDPMYLWAAEQIASDPLDFYGFDVNWHGFIEPNYVANKNPPLIGFFLAAVSVVFGWSERGLHLGMLLPMLALLGALHGIARRLVAHALDALRQLGCIKVNLQIRSDNAQVVAFYESLGFYVEDRISMGLHLHRSA